MYVLKSSLKLIINVFGAVSFVGVRIIKWQAQTKPSYLSHRKPLYGKHGVCHVVLPEPGGMFALLAGFYTFKSYFFILKYSFLTLILLFDDIL